MCDERAANMVRYIKIIFWQQNSMLRVGEGRRDGSFRYRRVPLLRKAGGGNEEPASARQSRREQARTTAPAATEAPRETQQQQQQ
jgi:hypothetical protein